MIRSRTLSIYDVIVFNQCPCRPWVGLLHVLWRQRYRTSEMVPCENLDISLSESHDLRPNNTIINRKSHIHYNNCYLWDGKLQTATVHSWIFSTQMWHTAFGAVGRSALLRKKADWDGWWSTMKISRMSRKVFYILPWTLNLHWFRFPPAMKQNSRICIS